MDAADSGNCVPACRYLLSSAVFWVLNGKDNYLFGVYRIWGEPQRRRETPVSVWLVIEHFSRAKKCLLFLVTGLYSDQ